MTCGGRPRRSPSCGGAVEADKPTSRIFPSWSRRLAGMTQIRGRAGSARPDDRDVRDRGVVVVGVARHGGDDLDEHPAGGHVDDDLLHGRLILEALTDDGAVAEVPADLTDAAVLPEAVPAAGGVGLDVTGDEADLGDAGRCRRPDRHDRAPAAALDPPCG